MPTLCMPNGSENCSRLISAGLLSSVRMPSAIAQLMASSRYWRMRFAVGCLVVQIGLSTCLISASPMSAIGRWPITG